MKRRLFLLLALGTVVLAGCGDDNGSPTGTPPASVVGTWSGNSGGVTRSMTLSQAGSSVSGFGTSHNSSTGSTASYTVDGTVRGADIDLSFNFGSSLQGFDGVLETPTSMTGVLTAPGQPNRAFTFTRQ